MDTSLLGPCNVYCGNCALPKKGKCLGCAEESKNIVACSDCRDYPCGKYDKGIFAESFIKWVREKLKET